MSIDIVEEKSSDTCKCKDGRRDTENPNMSHLVSKITDEETETAVVSRERVSTRLTTNSGATNAFFMRLKTSATAAVPRNDGIPAHKQNKK